MKKTILSLFILFFTFSISFGQNEGVCGSYKGYLDDDNSLDNYQLIKIDMTTLVSTALKDTGLSSKVMARSTNMFALGLLYWLY